MLYPEQESRHLEFKSAVPAFSQLIKTCIAFANGVGGKIIIGVEDKTREIVGVNDSIRRSIYEEFPNSLFDSTAPNLIAEIYEKNYGAHNIIIIEIPNILKKPAYVKSEGIPKGVYLRAGSSTRRASEDHIEELERDNRRFTYDEEIIHADIDILHPELIKKAYPMYTNTKLLTEKILGQKIADPNKYLPTIAATLWFCESPDVYVNSAHIRCTRFDGVDGRNIIQTNEVAGSLSEQIENSFALIKSWLLKDFALKDTKLEGKMIVPAEALREVILNALMHRKYSIPGAIKIALYDDRLEIFSPGNFPGLVDINNLGDGTTYLRNPIIAKIARRLRYIEQLGTGINLIIHSCKKHGLKSPEFIEGADSVKVIFNFIPDIGDNDEDNLIALFSMRDSVTINEIVETFKISRNTATRRLNKLVDAGVLKRVGKGPSVRYFLIAKPNN